jgi:hypothetical protein
MLMKKQTGMDLHTIMVCGLLAVCCCSASAQTFKLNAYGGYLFQDDINAFNSNSSYCKGKVEGAIQWGLGAEYRLHPQLGLELLYMRQDTRAPLQYYDNGIKEPNFDVAINYILLSGNAYLSPGKKVDPYLSLLLGTALLQVDNPDNGEDDHGAKFAWGLKAAVGYAVSKQFGMMAQASFLSAFKAVGGSLFLGESTSANARSVLLQFGLHVGVSYQFR